MSGLIFVALFVGWAIYLIPKFMRDHEELATTRTLQDFSARVRVFAATRSMPKMDLYGPDEPTIEISMAEVEAVLSGEASRRSSVANGAESRPLPTRAAAKKAAKRRRRVLLELLTITTIVGVLAGLKIAPLWSPAVPVAFVLVFLISARRAVHRTSAARRDAGRTADGAAEGAAVRVATARPRDLAPIDVEIALVDVDLARLAINSEFVEAEVIETPALANQLWDPVPMTLPTYIDKPAARRTVMSIELNQGIVSAGHDAADSELVRSAEATALEADTFVDIEAPRRAAGA